MAYRWNPDGEMDHYWAGDNHTFHGMERGYGPRDMDLHHSYNGGGHHQEFFTPHWDEHHEGGPYQHHRNMQGYENYSNRRGAGNYRNFVPRGRGYPVGGSSRQSQHASSSSKNAEATENTADDVPQSGKKGDNIHKEQESGSANQKQGLDARKDETETSRGGNQDIADKNDMQNQSKQQVQNNPHEEQLDDSGADSWKPLEETFDVTRIKQETVDMEIEEEPQEGNDNADKEGDKEEDETEKAIKKLPVNHRRGLMSTLIGLMGPEAQNKKPEPLPPPRPMKYVDLDALSMKWFLSDKNVTYYSTVEDDSVKYLGPPKRPATKSSISESVFLESGITSSMLAEANMEIDYDDRSLMPEDIGRDTSRPEFYCKLCQKQMTSLGNFRDHLNGKSHKSMLDAVKMGTKKIPKGKKKALKSVSELGQKSVCLEVVEGATESILGLSFITEYHSVTGVVCVCNLCAVKFDQNIVVSHTTGCKHRLRYMREKQPAYYVHLKKFGGKKSQLTTFLSDLAIQVEKDDGRGIPTIKVYHPEKMDDEEDSLNNDEYENRRLINEAKRHANVDDKDLESVDFQDWVNREMRRAKELYESQKRSPSPGTGDYGRSAESIRSGRSPSVMSDVRGRDYSRGDSHMSHHGSVPPSMFPHSRQEMYMLPPPPPLGFAFGRGENRRLHAFDDQNSLPPQMVESEPYGNASSYRPHSQFYRDIDPELVPDRHLKQSRSHFSSKEKQKPTVLFDYGHRSKDRERDDIRTSRQPARSGDIDDESPRRPARGREEREIITSRQPARGREDERDITSRQQARGREEERDITSRQQARGREEGREITSRQQARGREERGREDERDEISTSRKLAKNRAEQFDARDIITSRQSRNLGNEEVRTSVSRADKWEDDIQYILGHSGKKNPLDSLALLSSTYSSPEARSSPTPPRQTKKAKALPFSKTYIETMESQKRQKGRRISSELDSGLLESKRNSVRAEKFVEARSKSRSPDVVRIRRRSPEKYVDDRLASQQTVHLARRNAAQNVDASEMAYLQRERSRSPMMSRSPVHVRRQQKRSRSPSPVRTYKKPVATSSQSATDAEAERIANLLLELSSSLSGQEDPQIALQTLFSNADLTRALLSSKNSSSTAGKSSCEKSSGEKMHSARSAEVGEPSGRHRNYTSVEQPSRYVDSPDESRRYASNYSRSPETVVYQNKSNPSAHSLAMSQSSRAMQAAHSSRDRVAFSLSALKREETIRRSSLMNFDDDSDES